jgi:tellurite resistance protein
MYILKIIKFPDNVSAEFNHPVKLSFFPTISISFLLLAIAFMAVNPSIGKVLWALGTISQLGFVLYIISTWMHQEHFKVTHMNPAWFIPAVGNVMVPIAGIPLGFVELSWFFFSIGLLFWVILMTIVFYRILFHDPIPAGLLPTLFILIAPPAIGFIAYVRLTGELDAFARILYYSGLFLTLLLFTQLRRFSKLSFALSWWAYSFPMAAITTATLVMYEYTYKIFFMWLGGGLLVLMTLLIGLLLTRTGLGLYNEEICVKEG